VKKIFVTYVANIGVFYTHWTSLGIKCVVKPKVNYTCAKNVQVLHLPEHAAAGAAAAAAGVGAAAAGAAAAGAGAGAASADSTQQEQQQQLFFLKKLKNWCLFKN
jgi:F0F1-type ATP synthase membrane subunit c/vacuolar-type H+-ATPase subunit K